jgi:hypothetical protein
MIPAISAKRNRYFNTTYKIHTDNYNSIRYGIENCGWKGKLLIDMRKKERGEWKYSKDGYKITHPARTSLIGDISFCIQQGIPLKTKSFEYNPVNRSIYLYDEYVAKYDHVNGYIESFTLRNIDNKYTRYRLRDFGIDLVSLKQKTYWKITVGNLYYQYLLAIHDGEEGLKAKFKDIFPSMMINKPKESSGNVMYTIYCELRKDIEYPATKPRASVSHFSLGEFSQSSSILSSIPYYPENETYNHSQIRSNEYGLKHLPKISESIWYIKDAESRKFNLSLFLRVILSDCKLLKEILIRPSHLDKAFFYFICDHACGSTAYRLHIHDKMLVIVTAAGIEYKYSFDDLNISEFFCADGIILKPRCLKELKGFFKENTGDTSLTVWVLSSDRSKRWTLPYSVLNEYPEFIPPLLGKELLLA